MALSDSELRAKLAAGFQSLFEQATRYGGYPPTDNELADAIVQVIVAERESAVQEALAAAGRIAWSYYEPGKPDVQFVASAICNRIRAIEPDKSAPDSWRVRYAFDLIRATNTVTTLSLSEIEQIINRALSGEFDSVRSLAALGKDPAAAVPGDTK